MNALPVDYLRPYQGYSFFDADASYKSLQIEVRRRSSQGLTFSAAYTFSKTLTTVSDTSIASGSPTELGLSISGQDAGNRLLGTYSAGNLSGQAARFLLNGSPQSGNAINIGAFAVPEVNNAGPYPRFYLRNPGIRNQDLSLFKNIHFGGEGKRYLQLRMEAFNVFNHPQFSGYNLTSNVVNGGGRSGSAIFSNFTGLTVTNNLWPAHISASTTRRGICVFCTSRRSFISNSRADYQSAAGYQPARHQI